jgi:hypothetical protein
VPTLRHKMAALVGAVLICSTVLLSGGPASAQSSAVPRQNCYPLSSCPPTPPCTVGSVSAGVVVVGQTITFTLCGDFAPGASVTVVVNGTTVFTKTATNGAVVVVITVASQTILQVDDPVNAPAICGNNAVVATGAKVGGGSSSPTGTFQLTCTSSTGSKGGLAFTGTNVMLGLLVALGLIALGTVLVVLQRRRRQTI